jgi:hypothetical protein
MRFIVLTLSLLSVAACGGATVTASDGGAGGDAPAPFDGPFAPDAPSTVTPDVPPTATPDARPVAVDAVATDAATPAVDDTALAYCRTTCVAVVRCNPGRGAAPGELDSARQWGDMRLRAGVWRQGAVCAAGLPCAAVGTGDRDALFERCVLPATMTLPPSVAASRVCAATEAFAARLGARCRDVPTGAECALVMPLFSDAALDAVRAICFSATATCDAARTCLMNTLGIR